MEDGFKAGVPKLTGIAAFDGDAQPASDRDDALQAPVEHAEGQRRPMYGVHVEYPPDYDFNLGGTGLEAPTAPLGAGTEASGRMESKQPMSHAGSMHSGGMEAAEGYRGIRDNEVRRPASAIDARPFRVCFCAPCRKIQCVAPRSAPTPHCLLFLGLGRGYEAVFAPPFPQLRHTSDKEPH